MEKSLQLVFKNAAGSSKIITSRKISFLMGSSKVGRSGKGVIL